MTVATRAHAASGSRPARGARRAGAFTWELRRLMLQARVRALLVVAAVAPLLFVAAVEVQGTLPEDTLFGRWVKDSGFATPLVVLGFVGQWGIPAVVGVVAGDLFSGEDRHGTWWLLLGTGRSRAGVVWAKAAAGGVVAAAVVVVLAVFSLGAGALFVNAGPLVDLGGGLLSGGQVTARVLEARAAVLPPTLAFTALALLVSAAGRNGVIGVGGPLVIGVLLQLVSLVNLPVAVRVALPTAAFDAWHGLFIRPVATDGIWWGLLVSAVWSGLFLGVVRAILVRRDLGRTV